MQTTTRMPIHVAFTFTKGNRNASSEMEWTMCLFTLHSGFGEVKPKIYSCTNANATDSTVSQPHSERGQLKNKKVKRTFCQYVYFEGNFLLELAFTFICKWFLFESIDHTLPIWHSALLLRCSFSFHWMFFFITFSFQFVRFYLWS